MQILRTVVVVIGLSVLTSGCLLAAAGAVELDRQNHKAPPPPPAPSVSPEGGAAQPPAGTPQGNGTTNL